jgi:hypothetical protein
MLENAKPHPKYGYLQITTSIALKLTEEEIAELYPAQRGFVRRVQRHAAAHVIPKAVIAPAVKAAKKAKKKR